MKKKETSSVVRLLEIMNELREKCPWDREQTIDSLKTLTLEESYELLDAINEKDYDEIKNELGDLLLHIVFYSKIASEKSKFNFNDVVETIIKKLIVRHPHVFDSKKNISKQEVEKNWEKIKLKEGKKSILSGVPKTLPALIKSERIQDKVSKAGFKWNSLNDSKNKIKEELNELNIEIKKNSFNEMEEEFGDLMFSLVNYGNLLGINSENALEKANKKFIERFKRMETLIKKEKIEIDKLKQVKLVEYWRESK
ncbi:MAG: nucleoside triphosphate pyrophosphohydrolase [Bacteroidota bacterium]